jgi:nucleoside-diphosphate-sugar epimerase
MKVAVTGASGFLGTYIVGELLTRGCEVLAISRRTVALPEGAETLVVTDYLDLPAADALIHLAERSSAQVPPQEATEYSARTIERTRALVQGGRYAYILYGSSGAVYGDQSPLPHHPDESPVGTSIYARTKLACERLVMEAGGAALRLGNVVGPRMSATTVLARVLEQIPGSGQLCLHDDSAVRDFIWVGDVAECLAAFLPKKVSGAFNVGSGQACSVRRLAETALQMAGESHRPIVSETRSSSPSQLVLDISATERAVSWTPRTRLDAAIRKTLESRHV